MKYVLRVHATRARKSLQYPGTSLGRPVLMYIEPTSGGACAHACAPVHMCSRACLRVAYQSIVLVNVGASWENI